jgi:hypothetical protein
MSKIEDLYDAITTIITDTVATDYKRIPNPYILEINSHLILQKGYGIRIDAGRDTNRVVGCLMTWERLFTIILTSQITTTENNTAARILLEKGILDDHDALVKAFYANVNLTGQGYKASISDDSGIQPIVTESGKFFTMELSLFVEYQDSVS